MAYSSSLKVRFYFRFCWIGVQVLIDASFDFVVISAGCSFRTCSILAIFWAQFGTILVPVSLPGDPHRDVGAPNMCQSGSTCVPEKPRSVNLQPKHTQGTSLQTYRKRVRSKGRTMAKTVFPHWGTSRAATKCILDTLANSPGL